MLLGILKRAILSLHPMATQIYLRRESNLPFLCIVTPVFDPALPSLKKLIADFQNQTFPEFIHILISNGPSPEIKEYLKHHCASDKRFMYVELKKEPQDPAHLQANIGKRKNYGMKHFKAERYVFIDADSKIIDKDFTAKLYLAHVFIKKDILVAQIQLGKTILPKFPLYIGHIDLTNYTFSRKIAQQSHYPTKPGLLYALATDYYFFRNINTASNTVFLPFTYLAKNARKSFRSVRSTLLEK